jgi:predicted ATP-grasp superfamily ATP-dependent carboligase
MPAGALVIGGDYGALGIVRSLGRRGIPVWVLAEAGQVGAGLSRFAQRRMAWPAGEAAQLRCLHELAQRHELDGWVVFPTGDEPAALLARHAPSLADRYRLTTPSWEAMRWAYDKRLTHALATRLGVAQPWTLCPRGAAELAEIDCPFPVVLKPAVKQRINRFTRDRAWRVEDRAALLARYAEASALVGAEAVVVQEMIPGGGETQFSFAALCAEGRPLAWLVARRARQYPVDFGHGSTRVETVAAPEIEAPARRLLAELRYSGLVELELKRDPRDGRAKLLDINPRTWAWQSLGSGAGVDFPWLAWRLARGEALPETCGRAGASWVRGLTDLAAACTEIRRGRLAIADYLGSLRRVSEWAVLALDDPLPALVDAPSLLWRAWSRREGRVAKA